METLAKFTERMSKVEKKEEFHVGNRHAGHSRAIFKFEGQICYLESTGFILPPKHLKGTIGGAMLMMLSDPKSYWWTDYMWGGKERAEKLAKHYNATLFEAPYAHEENTWFCPQFAEFEDLMRFVYDRFTGVFIKEHGEEPILYRDCVYPDEPIKMA